MSCVRSSSSSTRQRMTREGCSTSSSASMRRTTASSHTWVRQASTMPLARSSGASACSECSSSSTSPETSSHLQVPQLPAWQENGKGTPARSSEARMVSPASTGTGSAWPSRVICMRDPKEITMVSDCLGPKQNEPRRCAAPRGPARAARLSPAPCAAGGVPRLRHQRRRGFARPRRHPVPGRGESGRNAKPARARRPPGSLDHGGGGRHARRRAA